MAFQFVTDPSSVKFHRKGGAHARWGQMFDQLASGEDGAMVAVQPEGDEDGIRLARRLSSASRNQGKRTGCRFSVRRAMDGGVYVTKVGPA